MSTYLCVKYNNTTKKYTAKNSSEVGKKYLRVKDGYFPLTTETTTGTNLKIKVDNSTYRIVETYKATINTTTNTTTTVQSQSTSSVTTNDSNHDFRRNAMAAGYIPYKATYTFGSYNSWYGMWAEIEITGKLKSYNSRSTLLSDLYKREDYETASESTTGIIYYNSSKSNCYRIKATSGQSGMIIFSSNNATMYNSRYISLSTVSSTFYIDIPKDKNVYVGIISNIKNKNIYSSNNISAIIIHYTLYGGNHIAFSTENYTYETTSNTIANTTIETTSQ